MMKYLLFFFGMFFLSFIQSQNYKLINVNQESHFINSLSEIHSLRIDSTHAIGMDTLYSNYKTIQPSMSQSQCDLTLSGISWTGAQIVFRSNGNYVFFNDQHDSILIKSQALLNDSWTMYTFSNGSFIEATIISTTYQLVLGNMDSVKTIVLQAKNSPTNNITHPLNGSKIVFSKNKGLIKLLNFQKFPSDTSTYSLIGKSNPDIGINNLTASGVFDYDIGDEFHLETISRDSWSPWLYTNTYEKKVVLGKITSSNLDTIKYTYESCKTVISTITSTPGPDTTFSLDTIQELIVLSDFKNLNQLSFEPISDSSTFSIFSLGNTNSRRQKTINSRQVPHHSIPHCWVYFIGNHRDTYYIDGLGGGYYSDPNASPGAYSHLLVYYKKGNETWGNPFSCPLVPTDLREYSESKITVEVFPNPFSESLKIKVNKFHTNDLTVFRLYNLTGKLLRTVTTKEKTFEFKRGNLAPGIYTYQISVGNDSLIPKNGKLVVE